MTAQPREAVSKCPNFLGEAPACVTSTNDDRHPPVLRLAHARTGRHEQNGVAETLRRDGAFRHAVLDQLGFDRVGAAYRQTRLYFGVPDVSV